MAKKVEIGVQVNTKDAVKSVDNLDKELNGLEKTTKSATTRLRELEEEMADMGDQGSQKFRDLAKESGKLKDQINNAKAATKAYAADFPKLKLGAEAMMAIGAAAQAVTGITALLGIENESVAKSIQKMVAIQSVMNGVNAISNALSDETILGLKVRAFLRNVSNKLRIKEISQKITLNVVTAAQAVVTGTATVAQKALNLAVKSFPAFAIIAVVTTLVALFADWGKESGIAAKEVERAAKATKKLEEEQKALREEQERSRVQLGKNIAEFGSYITALKATNKNSKDRKELIDKINDTYGTTLKNLKDETAFQSQLNLVIDEYIKFQKTRLLLAANNEEITEQLLTQIDAEHELNELGLEQLSNEELIRLELKAKSDVLTLTELKQVKLTNQIKSSTEALELLGAEFVKLDEGPKFDGVSKSADGAADAAEELAALLIEMDEQVIVSSEDTKIKKIEIAEVNSEEQFNIAVALWRKQEELRLGELEKERLDRIENQQAIADISLEMAELAQDTIGEMLNRKASDRLQAIRDEHSVEGSLLKSQLSNREITQKEFDAKSAILQQKLREKEKQEARKAFNQQKGLALADIAIKLGGTIAGIQLNAAANPANAVTFGAAGISQAAILTGLAVATSGAQAALVASQKFRAARGGVVPGASSSIDSVDALLAPGEMVINSTSAQMFPQTLSTLNQAGGGIPLAPNVDISGGSPVYEQNSGTQVVEAVMVYSKFDEDYKLGERMRNRGRFTNRV